MTKSMRDSTVQKNKELLSKLLALGVVQKSGEEYSLSEGFKVVLSESYRTVKPMETKEQTLGKALMLALIRWRGRWQDTVEGLSELGEVLVILLPMINFR